MACLHYPAFQVVHECIAAQQQHFIWGRRMATSQEDARRVICLSKLATWVVKTIAVHDGDTEPAKQYLCLALENVDQVKDLMRVKDLKKDE